jgi:hypothetical protein
MLETCRDTILLNGFQQEISPDRSSSTETQQNITFADVNEKPGAETPGLNAKEDEVNISTLADLPFSRNAKELLLGEAAMPYNTDDLNFIYATVPHQLIRRFKGKRHRDTLALIVFAFSKCQRRPHSARTDDGRIIALAPYEFIFGRYSWAKELEMEPSKVHRIMDQISDQQFVRKVTSKSTSKYTIYSWSTKRFCKNGDQQSDQQSDQQTDHKEEYRESESCLVLSSEERDVYEKLIKESNLNADQARRLATTYSAEEIKVAFRQKNHQKKKVFHLGNWLEETLFAIRSKLNGTSKS